MAEKAKINGAKKGDLVPVLEPEFDIVNDGKGLRVFEVLPTEGKIYNREGLMKLKEIREGELANINALLEKMDELGVE
jgi:hypothetical protein